MSGDGLLAVTATSGDELLAVEAVVVDVEVWWLGTSLAAAFLVQQCDDRAAIRSAIQIHHISFIETSHASTQKINKLKIK